MNDRYDLERYIRAQEPVFAQVCAELADGRKQSHWMWFIFPQLRGLGSSSMAERYAIGSLAEALAYLAHPLLGERLRTCTQLVKIRRPDCRGDFRLSRRAEIPLFDDAVRACDRGRWQRALRRSAGEVLCG